MRRGILLALWMLFGMILPSEAQEFDYDRHTGRMYDNASGIYDFNSFGPGRIDEWRTGLKLELRKALGLDVIERSNPGFVPTAEKHDSEDVGYAIRERWIIRTETDVWLPVVLMIPKDVKGPVPLLITPHGHSRNTELAAGVYHSEDERVKGEEGERNIAVQAVQHGFLAIAPTARGFGATRSPKDIEENNTSSCRELMLRDLLAGRTPVGDRVWDIMKIIDWALENLPVDGRNVIVTGNSGGGTATIYAGALDERISMSLPGSAFATFEGSIGFRRHCECNYIPGILNLCEMGEIAGLTAPRAFCAINGRKDDLFPIEAAREAFGRTSEIYAAAGAPGQCAMYEGDGGHRYYKKGAWDFIISHLKR